MSHPLLVTLGLATRPRPVRPVPAGRRSAPSGSGTARGGTARGRNRSAIDRSSPTRSTGARGRSAPVGGPPARAAGAAGVARHRPLRRSVGDRILHGLAALGVARAPVRVTGHPRIRERAIQSLHAQRRRDDVVTLSLGLVVLLALVTVGLLRSPLLAVDQVVVRGVSEAQQQHIDERLRIVPGTNLMDVDAEAAAARVAALPWIADVVVDRVPPSTIIVRPVLVQAVAVGEVVDGDGGRYLLGPDGTVLEQATADTGFLTGLVDAEALPRILLDAAPVVGRQVDDPAVQAASAMAEAMPTVVADWVVSYSGGEDGDVDAALRVPREQGSVEVQVHLGRVEDVRTKAATIAALVEETSTLGYVPAVMDVRIPDRPVVRR